MTQREMWQATGLARATYLRLEHDLDENPPIRYLANCAIVLGCQVEDMIEPTWRAWWKRLPNEPDAPERPERLWRTGPA